MLTRLLTVLSLLRPPSLRARLLSAGRDRGDVPGWVLITLMTAGLVTAIWAIAGPQLADILGNALSITDPTG
jgi:hypothetical protein